MALGKKKNHWRFPEKVLLGMQFQSWFRIYAAYWHTEIHNDYAFFNGNEMDEKLKGLHCATDVGDTLSW